jgi:hypothetical protein
VTLGALSSSRIGPVGDEPDRLGVEAALIDGVENALEVRSASGRKDR